jgi:hypothetical protein
MYIFLITFIFLVTGRTINESKTVNSAGKLEGEQKGLSPALQPHAHLPEYV